MWDCETEACVEAEGFEQYWDEMMSAEDSDNAPDGWEEITK